MLTESDVRLYMMNRSGDGRVQGESAELNDRGANQTWDRAFSPMKSDHFPHHQENISELHSCHRTRHTPITLSLPPTHLRS